MVEPDAPCGHNGSGPAYSASLLHFVKSGLTEGLIGCVLMRTDQDEGAMVRGAIGGGSFIPAAPRRRRGGDGPRYRAGAFQ